MLGFLGGIYACRIVFASLPIGISLSQRYKGTSMNYHLSINLIQPSLIQYHLLLLSRPGIET